MTHSAPRSKAAAESGRTLSAVIADALREVHCRPRGGGPTKIDLPVFHGTGLLPGVDLHDPGTLLERIEGLPDTYVPVSGKRHRGEGAASPRSARNGRAAQVARPDGSSQPRRGQFTRGPGRKPIGSGLLCCNDAASRQSAFRPRPILV